MEEYALSIVERVKKVNFCSFAMGSGEKIIKNSKGLELHSKENICYTYISVIAEENGVVKLNLWFQAIKSEEKAILDKAGVCEKCGRPFKISRGRWGKFLACTGYPARKNIKKIEK